MPKSNPSDVLTAELRDPVARDWPYLASSYVKNYAENSQTVDAALTPRQKARFLNKTFSLLKLHTTFKVACDPTDKELILGWASFSSSILYYLYVKRIYRNQGLALSLLSPLASQSTIYCAHWTDDFAAFANNHPHLYRRIVR